MKENKKERGYVIVEATIVYPIAFLAFFAIYYSALFLYHKANLQSSLENALIYYKTQLGDNYIEALEKIVFDEKGSRIGNKMADAEYLNPYGEIFNTAKTGFTKKKLVEKEKIQNFIKSSYGIDAVVEVETSDYYFTRTIEAVATKELKTGLDLSLIGGKNTIQISAHARVVVTDNPNIIGTLDMMVDFISETKVGEKISDFIKEGKKMYEDLISKINSFAE